MRLGCSAVANRQVSWTANAPPVLARINAPPVPEEPVTVVNPV